MELVRTITTTLSVAGSDDLQDYSIMFMPVSDMDGITVSSLQPFLDPVLLWSETSLEDITTFVERSFRKLEDPKIAVEGSSLYYIEGPLWFGRQRQDRDSVDSMRFIDEIFRVPLIVIEQSPPTLTDFMSLARSGTGAALGAYVGFNAGAGAPLLLLLTVPSGIVLCATAMGAARAIERGLPQHINMLIRGLNRRPKRLPPRERS